MIESRKFDINGSDLGKTIKCGKNSEIAIDIFNGKDAYYTPIYKIEGKNVKIYTNDTTPKLIATLKNYVKQGTAYINGQTLTFDVEMGDKTSYKGTRLDENIVGKDNIPEKFNMKTGRDSITLTGDCGHDEIVTNKNEYLTLKINKALTDGDYKIVGNDILINIDNNNSITVKNYVKNGNKGAHVYTDYSSTRKELFEAIYKIISTDKNIKGTWLNESVTANANNKNINLGTSCSGKADEIHFDTTTEANYNVTVNNNEHLILDFSKLEAADNINYSIDGKDVYIQAGLNGVTLKNLAKKKINTTIDVYKNGAPSFTDLTSKTFDVEITAGKNSYKGSWLNENIKATQGKNETFNMGTGKDYIIYEEPESPKFKQGQDTVITNKGEQLYISFEDSLASANINYEITGNDIIIGKALSSTDPYIDAIRVKDYVKNGNDEQREVYVQINGEYKNLSGLTYELPTNLKKKQIKGTWLNESISTYGNNQTLNLGTSTDLGTKKDEITVCFEKGKTFTNANIIKNQGETLNLKLDYDLGASHEVLTPTTFTKKGNDLVIGGFKYDTTSVDGTVTIKNYATKGFAHDTLLINDTDIYDFQAFEYLYKFDETNVVKGKLTTNALDNYIDVTNYKFPDGKKGLTINSGTGNDTIFGSMFNDTINVNSLAEQRTRITEDTGTNKITTQKGDDTIRVTGTSSNTIKAGAGHNEIYLNSMGTNTVIAGNDGNDIMIASGINDTTYSGTNSVTTGNGDDYFEIKNGKNTIKSGNGFDNFIIDGGENNIKAGNGSKTQGNSFTIYDNSKNSIKSGKGADEFEISNSEYNYIDAGAGNDTFKVTAASSGINMIEGGAGNDTFKFTNEINSINYITDSKGNDTYDFSGITSFDKFDETVYITDIKGNNTLKTNELYDFYFDVEKVKGNSKSYSFNISNHIQFGEINKTTDATGDHYTFDSKIDVTGMYNISEIQVGSERYCLDDNMIEQIAENVAGWLLENKFSSSVAVLETGTKEQISAMLAFYNPTSGTGMEGGYALVQGLPN